MTITEKVAYLKGLMEGLELDETKAETKILKSLADIVNEIALTLEDMEGDIVTVHDYCEELDEDLGNVESFLLGEDEDEDCVCDDCDSDDCEDCEFCDCYDDEDYDDEDEDELTEEAMFAVSCPNCNDEVYFDSSINVQNLKCPGCGAKIDLNEVTE